MSSNVTAADEFYLGEDKVLRVTVYTTAAKDACADVSGFALSWKLARAPGQTAVLTKTSGGGGITISGAFNASPASNTQRINVALDDTDTDTLDATNWYHELKRTDAGSEEIILQGRCFLLAPVHLS